MIKVSIIMILCVICYNIGKSQGYEECQELFEEMHRQRCLRCESEE